MLDLKAILEQPVHKVLKVTLEQLVQQEMLVYKGLLVLLVNRAFKAFRVLKAMLALRAIPVLLVHKELKATLETLEPKAMLELALY